MSVLVQSIVDQIRVLSNLRRNPYFSDVDISEFADDGGKELADIFIAANEQYFQSAFDFTLAGGVGGNVVELPDDFQKANLLLLNPTSESPTRIPMLTTQLERAAAASSAYLVAGGGRRYFIADQQLEVLTPSMAAGNYRLLYVPQLASMAFPRAPDFTAAVRTVANIDFVEFGSEPSRSFTVTPNPGAPLVVNGVTLTAGMIVLIATQTGQQQNGVFRVAESDPGGTIFFRADNPLTSLPAYPTLGQTVLVTGGTVGAGYYVETAVVTTIDTSPVIWGQPSLPAVLTPWQRYLKVYGALTVRRGRNQPADDLAVELELLKKRASKMAANRAAEPRQAPITRSMAPWGGVGGGGGWGA